MTSGAPPLLWQKQPEFESDTRMRAQFSAVCCQFFKMGSANVRLRHFVTGFSLSKGVRVMVECNPIKKISAWQLQGKGIRCNFLPSREITPRRSRQRGMVARARPKASRCNLFQQKHILLHYFTLVLFLNLCVYFHFKFS